MLKKKMRLKQENLRLKQKSLRHKKKLRQMLARDEIEIKSIFFIGDIKKDQNLFLKSTKN